MPRLTAALLVLLSAIALAAPEPNVLDGKVVGVADGDTITVLDASNVHDKIRLAGIDAPEKAQTFGDRSKRSLSRAVMGKEVRIRWTKQDRYGRIVGTVWVAPIGTGCTGPSCPKTLDVNLAQLTVGLAWHFKKFQNEQPPPKERERYAFAEEEARAKKAGLWSEPDPVRPEDWRAGPAGGSIKKSKSGNCHAPQSASYQTVKNFTAFPTLEACLASGGRLPKQPGG